MLEKHIDQALIGKSYLSLLLSMNLLEKGEKVILLDDERMKFGDLYTNQLCHMEKSFLEAWGKEAKIEPLINIERYLKKKPLTFILDNTRIRLGEGPLRNYRELARKFPHCFEINKTNLFTGPLESDDFDSEVLALAERIGQMAYKFKGRQVFNLSSQMIHAPQDFKDLFVLFVTGIFDDTYVQEENSWSLRTFLYVTRGLFQKKLSITGNDVQLFHLFLSLLSPFYELDHKALTEDLTKVFIEKGGQFKKTQVREWKFYKDKPWSLELASYEGIIHPKNISLLGGLPKAMPIKLHPPLRSYTCLEVDWDIESSDDFGEIGERILYSSLNKIGTARPLWLATLSKNKIEFKIFVAREDGMKIAFIEKDIREMLINDLQTIFPQFNAKISKEEMNFGKEVWIEEADNVKFKKQSQLNKGREISILDASTPTDHRSLKQMTYFGPYKDAPLGLFSTMLEIMWH
jgi:hypothetical protein